VEREQRVAAHATAGLTEMTFGRDVAEFVGANSYEPTCWFDQRLEEQVSAVPDLPGLLTATGR
jgi:hypothetical protein